MSARYRIVFQIEAVADDGTVSEIGFGSSSSWYSVSEASHDLISIIDNGEWEESR